MNLKRRNDESMEEFLARVRGTVAPPPEPESCSICRYYVGPLLQCRRHAPVPIIPPYAPIRRVRRPRHPYPLPLTAWPLTERDDWCGDFEPFSPLDKG